MYPPPRPPAHRSTGVPVGAVIAIAFTAAAISGLGGCAFGAVIASAPAPASSSGATPALTRTAAPTTSASTPHATIKPKPKTPTIRAGTWRVPQEIKPGTWRTKGGDGCYWERLRGFSGRLSDIIANDAGVEGAAVVTIKATDKGFATHGCAAWKRIGK